MKDMSSEILPRRLTGLECLCLAGTSLLSGTSTLPHRSGLGLSSDALTSAAGQSCTALGSTSLSLLPDKLQRGCETFSTDSNIVLFHMRYLWFYYAFCPHVKFDRSEYTVSHLWELSQSSKS